MTPAHPPSRRFVLLDRDGTVNVECDYLSRPEQLVLLPGVGGALRRLRALGFGLAVLTNQSGVARGYFDLETVSRVHDRLRTMLKEEGVELDGIYLCPHGPDDDCACRKPRTGMIDRAVADFGFDPTRAFMIGDKAADVDLGRAVGATSILVRTGWGMKAEREAKCAPAVIVDDLAAAADWIERSVGMATASRIHRS